MNLLGSSTQETCVDVSCVANYRYYTSIIDFRHSASIFSTNDYLRVNFVVRSTKYGISSKCMSHSWSACTRKCFPIISLRASSIFEYWVVYIWNQFNWILSRGAQSKYREWLRAAQFFTAVFVGIHLANGATLYGPTMVGFVGHRMMLYLAVFGGRFRIWSCMFFCCI